MAIKDMQLRGHCQCCGNQQAVVKGRMSKHGYTVEHGWFEGVCSGNHFAPMEQDRTQTDAIIATIREEVANLKQYVADLQSGKKTPTTCKSGEYTKEEDKKRPGRFNTVAVMIPFKDGQPYYQKEAVNGLVYKLESRIRAGEGFARDLGAVADAYHGKELVAVAKKEPTKYIQRGEKKLSEGGKVMIALYQDGARVYWYFQGDTTPKADGSGSTVNRKYWTGSKAWRMLKDVEAV